MKTKIIALIMTTLISGVLLASCGEKSKQDASEVKEDVMELNKDLTRGAIDTAEEIKIAITRQWDKFKIVSENTIANTEREIEHLREQISIKNIKERAQLNQKLDELEQRNIILKDKLAVRTKRFKENMIEFNEKAKANEKDFERAFNRDMNALENALQDLFKDTVD